MSLIKPIHHTFAPHVDRQYLLSSIGLLLRPWKWKKGHERTALTHALSYICNGHAYLFSSGREALLALLRAMHLQPGEEIIIQGYTCVVLPNAIHAAGGVPVYVDIERDTLNLNCAIVEKAITPRTRAIICQHTFGIPADTVRLREICDAHAILLIEDLAHVFPDTPRPDDETTDASMDDSPFQIYGDASFFSFGRDKAISGVSGGAVVTKDNALAQGLEGQWQEAGDLTLLRIKRYLLYPLAYSIAKPFIGIGVGKALLKLFRTLGIFVPIVTSEEKAGHQSTLIHHIPNACALLALNEIGRLTKISDHRQELTAFYITEAQKNGWTYPSSVSLDYPLQKFPLLVENAGDIRRKLKSHNIHLDDGWTDATVCPASSDESEANYRHGSCPEADRVGLEILSLPTHPTMTMKQAQELVQRLQSLLHGSH